MMHRRMILCLLAAAPYVAKAQTTVQCETPIAQRTSDLGCYLVTAHDVGILPAGDVFWHLYTYRSVAAARAQLTGRSAVVRSFGKVWVYTIAELSWRPRAGERVDVIGPLVHDPNTSYVARYMEATFAPNTRTAVHTHSGPEAWYVLSGAQCLETPDGVTVVRAGGSAVVPQGPPMMLSSVGSETRRSVLLVLHPRSKPWADRHTDWTPKGACPK